MGLAHRTTLSQAHFILVLAFGCFLTPASGVSEFSLDISQKGADQLSNFTLTEAMKLMQKNSPMTLHIKSKKEPKLPPLGRVDMMNKVAIKNIRLLLQKDTIGLVFRDVNLTTEANLTAELWPVPPFGEETVWLNVSLPQTYLGIATDNSDLGPPTGNFWLKSCSITDPRIEISTKTYWLLNGGLKLGASYLRKKFPSFICPQFSSLLDVLRSMLVSTVPLAKLMDVGTLPKDLRNVSLKYELVGLRVTDGHMGAGISVGWHKPGVPNKRLDFQVNDPSPLHLELDQFNGHHATLWIQEDIINEFVDLIRWDFVWMQDTVPVSDAKIPEDSRKFLMTLCHDCFFKMRVWNHGAPTLIARNGSLSLHRHDRVKLWVVNPRHNLTSIFVSFIEFFDGKIVPYVENGHLKAEVDLLDVNVTMEKSAFPPEWGFFVRDLVRGMILGRVWPGVKTAIEKFSKAKGLPLPASCGLEPNSTVIHLEEGKLGVGANLNLALFDADACSRDMKAGLPQKFDSFAAVTS